VVSSVIAAAGAGLALAAGPGLVPAPGQLPSPPTPIVSVRGESLTAARGSYCWGVRYDNGTFGALCADTFRSPSTRDALPARGKQMLHIEFGTTALEVTASLPGKRFRGPFPVDEARHHWMVRLPRRLDPRSVLSFGARFAQGGVPYGVTLERARRPQG
jgi:hypothetical protein